MELALQGPCARNSISVRISWIGKVTGAVDQKLDKNNFGLTNVAAGTQIRQVGNDEEPIDLSKQENVEAFLKDMGTWG